MACWVEGEASGISPEEKNGGDIFPRSRWNKGGDDENWGLLPSDRVPWRRRMNPRSWLTSRRGERVAASDTSHSFALMALIRLKVSRAFTGTYPSGPSAISLPRKASVAKFSSENQYSSCVRMTACRGSCRTICTGSVMNWVGAKGSSLFR